METLLERIESYEGSYDYKILNKLPVIARVDAKNFKRISKSLKKPFCPTIMDTFSNTMFDTIVDIDGAVLGYQFGDEINFIINKQDNPWLQNKIQKICSTIASKATINFIKNLSYHDDIPQMNGDVVFDCSVFPVPNLNEAVNYLIHKQYECFKKALNNACTAELIEAYGREKANKILYSKNLDEKVIILNKECDINFHEYYPPCYTLGICSYKVPHLLNDESDNIKNRWIIDDDVVKFSKNKDFISNILYSGHDVYRKDRDLIE